VNPIHEIPTSHSPESLLSRLRNERGTLLLRSASVPDAMAAGSGHAASGRYSFLTARPFLTFRSAGLRCVVETHAYATAGAGGLSDPGGVHFGNPWRVLESLLARYELLDEVDLPFPLGGCFGFWGYELKNHLEPDLPRHAINDLEWADCHAAFHASLVAFDHALGKTFVISTGMLPDGSRSEASALADLDFWRRQLETTPRPADSARVRPASPEPMPAPASTLSRAGFLERVRAAQRYIRSGDIYQVNLSRRLTVPSRLTPAELFEALCTVSPAPFSACVDAADFQLVSSSPEQFLRLSGRRIQTRPIKGTRPRSPDPVRDAQLSYELQTSLKETAELVMITDLLRNDLGKVCEFGSVHVPEIVRLERYAQVQHLVSTVEGRLRPEVSHLAALAACFPGGSITGAPKFRAMEIIDELEPVTRGPYTGALGYLGFNRESQFSIVIRTALCRAGLAHFNVGAGIVADSVPEQEFEETEAKARGFFEALQFCARTGPGRITSRTAR
jgi:para-aminobenzoate synthetase component 1